MMNDSDEPQRIDPQQVVDRVERIMSLQQANTETLRSLWSSGELEKLPCHDRCDGHITVHHEGQRIRGFCPMYMEKPVCPLATKEERQLLTRLERAGFPKRYQQPKAEQIRCLAGIEQYLDRLDMNVDEGRGLILAGDVGVGKTMALAYMARRMLKEGHGVWKVVMQQYIDALTDRSTRKTAVERALKVEILMLDDFGAGHIPEFVLGILEGIVEARYGRQAPVIVSTNLTREQLIAAPEFRRMVDRWRQCNTLIVVGGSSQRVD